MQKQSHLVAMALSPAALGTYAGVQPRWIQGDSKVGTVSASLEKYIFNYRHIERLEKDSVVGRLVEKRG